ncbi:MAG: glycosyl hydrolase family 28 protein [bacterium]|nr:glycosyl hydrolase family 28 protein [bacterium]
MKTNIFSVLDYGAKSDATHLQTKALQAAIDACHKAGGGEVLIPEGTYLTGSLRLYSHITLHLLSKAKLLGSNDYKDYEDFHVPSTLGYLKDPFYVKEWNLPPYYIYGLICAFDEEDICIVGEEGAVLDGQDCQDTKGEEGFRGPMGIIFCRCHHLRLQGYTFQNSANWSHQLDSCKEVAIEGVTILAGHDGFNLHHCRNINIKHCHLETGDDCIAGYDIKHLKVSDCYLNTACNSLRIGGQHILLERCLFEGPGKYPHLSEGSFDTHAIFKYYSIRSDEKQEEGDDIVLSHCEIRHARRLLSYHYRKEGLHQDLYPLRSLRFEDCQIEDMKESSIFCGNGERGRLIFQNVRIRQSTSAINIPFLETDACICLEWEKVEVETPILLTVHP